MPNVMPPGAGDWNISAIPLTWEQAVATGAQKYPLKGEEDVTRYLELPLDRMATPAELSAYLVGVGEGRTVDRANISTYLRRIPSTGVPTVAFANSLLAAMDVWQNSWLGWYGQPIVVDTYENGKKTVGVHEGFSWVKEASGWRISDIGALLGRSMIYTYVCIGCGKAQQIFPFARPTPSLPSVIALQRGAYNYSDLLAETGNTWATDIFQLCAACVKLNCRGCGTRIYQTGNPEELRGMRNTKECLNCSGGSLAVIVPPKPAMRDLKKFRESFRNLKGG